MRMRSMDSSPAPEPGDEPKPRPFATSSAALPFAGARRPHAVNARGSVAEMAEEIAAAFVHLEPSAVMLFASEGESLAPLSAALNQAFGPECRVLGCSSAGEFAFARHESGGVAALAFPAAHFRVKPVWLRDLRNSRALDWMAALRGASEDMAAEMAAEAAAEATAGMSAAFDAKFGPETSGASDPAMNGEFAQASEWTRFGVLLIDGLSQREELVSAMTDAALPGILTLGGSAGDGLRFERAHVALDGESLQDSALFCLMATDFQVREVVFDHILPTETRVVVTDARPEDRLILEIDAEPAAEEYARLIGLPKEALGPSAFAQNPLLVRIGGRNFVRAISEVAEDGALRLMSSVETGMVMTIGRAENLTDGLEERLCLLEEEPELILGFDCILRRIALERAGLEETAGRIFRRHRVAGFNTYGEQHGGMHVNQTFVGLAFIRRAPRDRTADSDAD